MRALWLAKSTSTEDEWEDGFAFDEAGLSAAVADGASSAANAGLWARQLVSAFVERPFDLADPGAFGAWLGECQRAWTPPAATADHWWTDAVSSQPSWATFAALRASERDGAWTVSLGAVGDTCWFLLRHGALVTVVPALEAGDFGTHPELVGTGEESRSRTVGAYVSTGLDGASGDIVLGLTDALAEWALAVAADHPKVWAVLTAIGPGGLRRLVDNERTAGRLVDDDVTMVRCRLGETP